MTYAILAALLLCGCAPRATIYDFRKELGFGIVTWDGLKVDETCRRLGARLDDKGRVIPQDTRIRCCYDFAHKWMWVGYDSLSCISHELCHIAKGWTEEAIKYCDGIHARP